VTGIFRANNPLNASILFVYGLLLKLPFLWGTQRFSVQSSDGFLYKDIIALLKPAFDSWSSLAPIVTYLLLFTQAITINYFINAGKMVPKPNYLYGMTYLLISSFFPSWNVFSAALLVTTVLLWIFGKLMSLGNSQKIKGNLFNIGFVIGICSFLYMPSIGILLLVIFGLMIARPPKIAEWAMVLLGFATIWYLLAAWLFLSDRFYHFFIPGLKVDLPDIHFTPMVFIRIGLIALLFLIGVYFIQAEAAKQVIQVRKRWSIILAGIFVMIGMPFRVIM